MVLPCDRRTQLKEPRFAKTLQQGLPQLVWHLGRGCRHCLRQLKHFALFFVKELAVSKVTQRHQLTLVHTDLSADRRADIQSERATDPARRFDLSQRFELGGHR